MLGRPLGSKVFHAQTRACQFFPVLQAFILLALSKSGIIVLRHNSATKGRRSQNVRIPGKGSSLSFRLTATTFAAAASTTTAILLL